jgi:hypothetical protein
MEQQLKLKLKSTIDVFDNFIKQSEDDLLDEETELLELT